MVDSFVTEFLDELVLLADKHMILLFQTSGHGDLNSNGAGLVYYLYYQAGIDMLYVWF